MLIDLILIIFIIFILMVLVWQISLIVALIFGAPTVYAKRETIIDAFKMAGLKPNQIVYDLGCGNARALIVACKDFKARGVGLEISPFYFILAKINVFLSRESKNIKIKFGNLRNRQNLKNADIVFLYLFDKIIEKIEPMIFEAISPETKIISLAFPFKNHRPALKHERPGIYVYDP